MAKQKTLDPKHQKNPHQPKVNDDGEFFEETNEGEAIITDEGDVIVVKHSEPLNKIPKYKKPLFLTHKPFIGDVSELAGVLTDFHQKYIKHDDQIVYIRVNTTKECYLELFRTRKINSKELVEFYEKSYDYYIQNHISNRLLNNSEEGRMTQLRICLEGILGLCYINEAPAGIVRGCMEQYLSIIDKGNWTIFHHAVFDKMDPKNGEKTPQFTANELCQVLINSSMWKKDDGLMTELQKRILSINVSVPMTLVEWFTSIDRKDLIDNYLESPFTLSIIVGPQELLMKEMIDSNNIINLWTAINFFISKWQLDGTSTDFFKLLNDVFNNKTDDKYKILKKVLYSKNPETSQIQKLRGLARSCREWVLFLPIILEIFIKNDKFGTKELYKIADDYHKVSAKIDNSPLMKLYSDYVFNKNVKFDLDKAYTFLSKWFEDESVSAACVTITKTFQELTSTIIKQEETYDVVTWVDTNPISMGFRNKSQEDFQIAMMAMVYSIIYSKQSMNTEHITHILTTANKLIIGSFNVVVDDMGEESLSFDDTTVGQALKDLCTRGRGSYVWKAPLIQALLDECTVNFNEKYGKKQKNTAFRKLEIENLQKMSKIADNGDALLKFGFLSQKGKYKSYSDADFMGMSWFHFEAGVDQYDNGCLWEFSNNAAVGAASVMGFQTKREAYDHMIHFMRNNKEKLKLSSIDIIIWDQLLDVWDKKGNFDENLQKIVQS